jgi:formylglycine-generating enzyme required for sulfatase activity
VEPDYAGEIYVGDVQVDVQVGTNPPPPTTKERYGQQLRAAARILATNPNQLDARFQQAEARFHLGELDKALSDFSWLIGKSPKTARFYQFRAVLYARQGKAKQARADFARFQQLTTDPSPTAYLDAVVSAYLGDDAAGLKRLEAALVQSGQPASFLYNAACAYALASQAVAKKEPARAGVYASRAVALLKEAVDKGQSSARLHVDPDLDPLRDYPAFRAWLRAANVHRHYAAVWHPLADLTSFEVHGLDPAAHLARCRQLIAQGYRPTALSVASMPASGGRQPPVSEPLVTASVWHRPVVAEDDKERLAKRQANAAVAMLKMGRPQKVWPLLRHSEDPRVRSYLIHRLSPLGADPRALVQPLEAEKDVSVRRALLLCLGEFGEKEFPPAQRRQLLPQLLDLYRTHPDPGLHGSVAWLLQQWGWQKKLTEIDQGLATGKVLGGRKWYVNQQGQTIVIIDGPAEFLMGSPRTEAGREGGVEGRVEKRHKQRIPRSFALAAHEVTVEQFRRFRKDFHYNPEYARTADSPVNEVTWYEAAEYCNWLSKREGIPEDQWCYEANQDGKFGEGMRVRPNYLRLRGYRLPTEAEWEYACRAGAVTSRYYGEAEELLEKYAWYAKNSLCGRLLPGANFKPNDWGLFDMLGNANEWCQDPVLNYPPGIANKASEDWGYYQDITGRDSRVLRGGSFTYPAVAVRSAPRLGVAPWGRYWDVGFRPARTFTTE